MFSLSSRCAVLRSQSIFSRGYPYYQACFDSERYASIPFEARQTYYSDKHHPNSLSLIESLFYRKVLVTISSNKDFYRKPEEPDYCTECQLLNIRIFIFKCIKSLQHFMVFRLPWNASVLP